MIEKRPSVGIGVFVIKDGKILIGKRKSKLGNGTWGLTGGHLEFGESWEECAFRETLEESGISITDIKYTSVTNDVIGDKHYVSIFLIGYYDSGDLKIMEPDKFEEWKWVEFIDIKKYNLFKPLENLLDTGYNVFDNK